MRRLREHETEGANSLLDWWRAASPLKVAWNYFFVSLSRMAPSLSMKRALLRATGMKVGRDVSVGLHAMFDLFFPELIELGDGCIIGYDATILSHEFLRDSYRVGRTKIGRGAVIGANSTVLAGVEVGDGALVSAMTLVNRDVKKGEEVGGVPCSRLRR